jgi:hypothetical protein
MKFMWSMLLRSWRWNQLFNHVQKTKGALTFVLYCTTLTFVLYCTTLTFVLYCTTLTCVLYCTTLTFVLYCITLTFVLYCTTLTFVLYCNTLTFVLYCTTLTFVLYCTTLTFVVVQYNTNVNAPLVFCTWLKSWFHLQLLNYIDHIKFIPGFSSCYSIFSFMCRSLFVLFPFHLAIVLSVRRSTDSDYPFCVFKLFLQIILFDLRLLLLQNPLWKRKRWAYIFQVSY